MKTGLWNPVFLRGGGATFLKEGGWDREEWFYHQSQVFFTSGGGLYVRPQDLKQTEDRKTESTVGTLTGKSTKTKPASTLPSFHPPSASFVISWFIFYVQGPSPYG